MERWRRDQSMCFGVELGGASVLSPRDGASAIQSGHPSTQSCDTWQSTASLNQYNTLSQRKPDRLDSVEISEKLD
jgi:hypothetical protein